MQLLSYFQKNNKITYLLNYKKTFTVLQLVTSKATIGMGKAALVLWRGRINDLLSLKYIAQALVVSVME